MMDYFRCYQVKPVNELTSQEISAKIALVKDSIREHQKSLAFLVLSLGSLESEMKSRKPKGKIYGSDK